jgi:hypothetical protein
MKFQNTVNTIDGLTGEIIQSDTTTYESTKLPKEPAYIKMYINDLGTWQGLTKTETEVLHAVASTVDYDGIIQITTYTKNKIVKRLGIKASTFANAMNKLISKMILQRAIDAPRQVFTLNPYFFGKGDWKDIIEQRKAFVVQITKAYGISLPSGTNTISFFETFEKLKRDPNTVDLISGKTEKEVQDEI